MNQASGSTTPGGVLGQALLVTLVSPATWIMALAVFMIRGGIVLVALPILVLPTPVGLGNVLSPTLSSIAFGTFPIEFLVVTAAIMLGTLVWLLVGGWIAAGLEAEGARVVARDEDVTPPPTAPRQAPTGDAGLVATQILIARLVAYLPLALALMIGFARLVFVTYRELTSPFDVDTPIVLRVLLASPEVVAALVVTWMFGEVVGGIAARRITLAGSGVARRSVTSFVVMVRHPLSALVRFLVPTVVLMLVVAPSVLAAGTRLGRGPGCARDAHRACGARPHDAPVRRAVGRRAAADRRRVCLASRRLDRRRSRPGPGRSGHRPTADRGIGEAHRRLQRL